ncbi:MAG: phosphoribosylglycinamide formyltransferase [Clostridia bacterium]|nr:phosphoribosylglycinamide formyltransferase [Clostridia bacterium]
MAKASNSVKRPDPPKARIAVLISGGGTNLQAILDAQKGGLLTDGEVTLVISNRSGAFGLERAKNAGVPALTITRKGCGSQEAFEDALMKALDENRTDLIVLAGWLAILSERFTRHYEQRIINIHPALIPSFCGEGFYGLKVHEAALAKGVKVSGATVHYVNEIPDGGAIIAQKAVRVYPGDTPEKLQLRIMKQAEWKLLPKAAQDISRQIRLGAHPGFAKPARGQNE